MGIEHIIFCFDVNKGSTNVKKTILMLCIYPRWKINLGNELMNRGTRIKTRATFETSNYPRRPWDRYTAPNSKSIGAEQPPPPPKKKKIKIKNEKLLILVIGLVEKNGRTVKQSSNLKTSSLYRYLSKVWKPNCQVFHLWLFCWWYCCSFAMCIPVSTNIHGSVAFPVLLPIDKRKIHIIIET